jgi:hypothetical protein
MSTKQPSTTILENKFLYFSHSENDVRAAFQKEGIERKLLQLIHNLQALFDVLKKNTDILRLDVQAYMLRKHLWHDTDQYLALDREVHRERERPRTRWTDMNHGGRRRQKILITFHSL